MLREILIYGISFGFVAILVYVMKRYGPVNHSWMRIPRDIDKRMKQANAEFIRMNPDAKKQTPTGRHLYKKRLVSHDGLIIYQDGIYAKFSVGSKGKYRFKRFDMISDIFPVEVENPFAKTDSVLMGLKSWKQLQIETSDYEVILIDSRKHNFDRIIPILKKAMGSWWEQLYRENEIIRGKIIEGQVGWHSLIRDRAPPGEIKGEETFVEMKESPKDKSRGSLLFEESPDVVNSKAKGMNRLGAILAVGGVLFFIILILIFTSFPVPGGCLFSISVMLTVLGIVFLILAWALFRVARWRRPLKVYEHGTTNFIIGTGQEFFIPFGLFKNVSEGSNFFEGSYYKLEAKDARYGINLNKKIPGIERHMEYIRAQIGRPDLDYPLEISSIKPMMKKLEYIVYGVMIALSLVLGFYMSNTAFSELGGQYLIFGYGFFFPLICIIAIFLAGHMFIKIHKSNNSKTGINLKAVGVIFIFALAVFFFNFYFAFFIWNEEALDVDIRQDAMPQTYVSISMLTNNSQIMVNDNLVLKNNEYLLLQNTTLTINCTTDKEYSIWIGDNAHLELINCVIQPNNDNLRFGFEIYGFARIVNTTISTVWGDENKENWDGGIEIYSDSVSIINSTISNGRTNGILIFDCSPLIKGNIISECPDDGMEIHYSEAVIEDNIFEDNGWGIILWPESDVEIHGNTFRNNVHGISIQASSPSIDDNRFTNNEEYAISYDSGSDPIITNNVFADNGEDIQEPSIDFLAICGIIIITLAIIFYVILFYEQKKNFGQVKDTTDNDPDAP